MSSRQLYQSQPRTPEQVVGRAAGASRSAVGPGDRRPRPRPDRTRRAHPAERRAAACSSSRRRHVSGHGVAVLLVEDDDDQARLVSDALAQAARRRGGRPCDERRRGCRAAEWIRRGRSRSSAHELPDGSGMQVLDALRAAEPGAARWSMLTSQRRGRATAARRSSTERPTTQSRARSYDALAASACRCGCVGGVTDLHERPTLPGRRRPSRPRDRRVRLPRRRTASRSSGSASDGRRAVEPCDRDEARCSRSIDYRMPRLSGSRSRAERCRQASPEHRHRGLHGRRRRDGRRRGRSTPARSRSCSRRLRSPISSARSSRRAQAWSTSTPLCTAPGPAGES